MRCKIIAQASTRYAAKYQVQTHGRVYEARVEDNPGEACIVHTGIDRGSDWLGSDDSHDQSDRTPCADQHT